MQRRVAAIYFVFFLVLGASAYSVIALAEEPAVDVSGETYSNNDMFTRNGQEYTVSELSAEQSEGDGHGGGGGIEYSGTITWTNESFHYSKALNNNSTVPATAVAWSGQQGRYEATLNDGDTVRFNGSNYTVSVNQANVTFSQGNNSTSFAVNDTVPYRGNQTTLASVEPNTSATLAWGDSYRVAIANTSDPNEFTLVQEFNASQRLLADPAVENQTVTRSDGNEYVVYQNGSTQPLSEYLPAPESKTFSEGDTVQYQGNETTVGNVTTEAAPLEWQGPKAQSAQLGQAANVTLGQETYLVYFAHDGNSITLTQDFAGYNEDVARQGYFQERMNGLWGVVIISGLAGVIIVMLAYMPVRG